MPIFPVTFLTKTTETPYVGDKKLLSSNGFDISTDLTGKFWNNIRISDDGQKILAVTYTDVYTSNDAGTSWSRCQNVSANARFGLGGSTSFYVAPFDYCATSSDHQYMYLRGELGRLYVSSDYGNSFSNSNSWSSISSVSCSANGKNVIVAVPGGLAKSTDFAQTFATDSSGITGNYISASDDHSKIAVYSFGSTSNGPFISVDSGNTWINYKTIFGAVKSFNSISMNYDGQKMYVSIDNVGVTYYSNNSGTDWYPSSLPSGGGTPTTVTRVATSTNGNSAIIHTRIGFSVPQLYFTTNSGSTWATACSASIPYGGSSADYLNIDDPGTKMHAIISSRFFYSSNSGNSFAQTFNSCLKGCSDGTLTNASIIATNTSNYTYSIYTSSDSGNTWTSKANSIGLDISNYYPYMACDKNTGNKIFVAKGSAALVYSLDFGDNWATINLSSYMINSVITDIVCDATATNIYVACSKYYSFGNNFILYSSDGGSTWVKKDIPTNFESSGYNKTSISCSYDGSEIVAVTSNSAIHYSSDYGNVWSDLSSAYAKPIGRPFISRDGSYIAIRDGSIGSIWNTNAKYYISYDNGNTFTLASNNFNFDHLHQRAGSSNGQILYLSANSRVVGTLTYGWDNNTRYANNSYVWVSNNAGVNWSKSNSGIADWNSVDCTPDGNTAVAASRFNGKLFKTTDRGANWTDISPDLYPNPITGWRGVGMSGQGQYLSFVCDGNNYPRFAWSNFYFPWSYEDFMSPGYNRPNLNVKEVVDSTKQLFQNPITSGEVDTWGEGFVAGSNSGLNNITYNNDICGLSPYYYPNTQIIANKNWVGFVRSAYLGELPFYNKAYFYAAEANGSLYRACIGSNAAVSGAEGWTSVANAVTGNWSSITCTVTGNNAAACIGGSGGDIYITSDYGKNWTSASKTSTANGWTKICYTSYGSHLLATDNGGYIWYSTNNGSTWNSYANAGIKGWTSIAASGNGKVQIATESGLSNTGGYIWMSRDYGSTWSRQDDAGLGIWWDAAICSDGSIFSAVDAGSNKVWYNTNYYPGKGYMYNFYEYGAIVTHDYAGQRTAMSANGKYMYVNVKYPDFLMTSRDYGETWRAAPYTEYIDFSTGFACSGDGKTILGSDGNYIYVSSNYGEYFKQANVACYNPDQFYVSSNGQYMVFYDNGYVWKSVDYGENWTDLANSYVASTYLNGLSISEDGSKIFVGLYGSYGSGNNSLILSTDGGLTFANCSPPTSGYSNTIESGWMSADGSKLFALDDNTGRLFVSSDNGSNWIMKNGILNILSDGGGGRIKSNSNGSIVLFYGWSTYFDSGSVSYDGGESWVMLSSPPYEHGGIVEMNMSEDGKKFIFSLDWAYGVNTRLWVYKY